MASAKRERDDLRQAAIHRALKHLDERDVHAAYDELRTCVEQEDRDELDQAARRATAERFDPGEQP